MQSSQTIKVGFVSLGCAKNLVDSEVMLGSLLRDGMQVTPNAQEADVVIVNTCGFIEASKKESIDAILKANELRETGNCKALIMAGCLTQRYPRDLQKELPEVDAIVGLNEVPRIGQIVREILAKNGHTAPQLFWSGPANYVPDYAAPRFRLTPKHHAYVKVAEGCNHPCTFCSIPRIRGKHRSRALNDVLAEIRALVSNGAREINLISQDTTFYGKDLDPQAPGPRDGKSLLCELLREIQQIDGEFWVRLLYTHPYHWNDELIETIAACDKVCRYVDMPLQHINDEMLKQMRRETSGQYIRDLIARIRRGIPGIALRTTFIVGFPGEAEKQFEELLQFIAEAKFERLGMFQYSQEDHTPAGTMATQLSVKEKKRRYQRAMALQQQVSREVQGAFVGQTIKVLIEERTEGGWVGRSHADAPEIDGSVQVMGPAQIGEFARVRITGASEYDLTGETLRGASAAVA
ncbi:MAG TPA: 30S ribosomal protein S12 methylthiotransferase RimO [Verrucomicrobiae bacterium]|nr:30S ribosomal protein S12 methylthiotransferase RimO [Verrucomicrobiae bacterium]